MLESPPLHCFNDLFMTRKILLIPVKWHVLL